MKIYVVDNGGQWTHREWRVLKYLKVETKIIPNTTPVSEINADGLVLSGGSPRICTESLKLGNVGDYIEKLKIPMLGICVSHQFMALYFKGKAGPADVPEFGKAEITITDKNEIFRGLPDKFTAWESHNDEIKELPECFEILAHSENCKIEAIKHKKRKLYGLQFHPEVEHTEHGEEMFKNFVGICENEAKNRKA